MRGAVDIETGALVLSLGALEVDELVAQLARTRPFTIGLGAPQHRRALRPLSQLVLQEGEDPVSISIEGESAHIRGGRAGFDDLARAIMAFAEYNDVDEPGMHMHIDPGGADGVLSPESAGLIIAGTVVDDETS